MTDASLKGCGEDKKQAGKVRILFHSWGEGWGQLCVNFCLLTVQVDLNLLSGAGEPAAFGRGELCFLCLPCAA